MISLEEEIIQIKKVFFDVVCAFVVLFWFVLGLGVSMFSLDSRGNN